MKFFGREEEIALLKKDSEIATASPRMTVLLGRRRIGKTWLLREAFNNQALYLLAKTENEGTLCETFQKQIVEYGIPVYGNLTSMREVFDLLFSYSSVRPFILIIDEFQEFSFVRKSIFADLQELWDKYASSAKIHLIVCGSMYTLMKEIFQSPEACLYKRPNRQIDLRPFTIGELSALLGNYAPNYTDEDLLCLYTLTGGVAKYVSALIDDGAYTKKQMLDCFANPTNTFLNEGNELMRMEFRKDSSVYYSILRLISEGKTSSAEMSSVLKSTPFAYLSTLETTYGLVKKRRPIFASEESRTLRYEINDNFMLFWFRFVYPNQYLVETMRTDLLLELINQGYNQFAGFSLERYFRQALAEKSRFTQIGNYWDTKGENEIDIVAVSALDKNALVAEVKLNPAKYSEKELRYKARKIEKELSKYEVCFKGLSLMDVRRVAEKG